MVFGFAREQAWSARACIGISDLCARVGPKTSLSFSGVRWLWLRDEDLSLPLLQDCSSLRPSTWPSGTLERRSPCWLLARDSTRCFCCESVVLIFPRSRIYWLSWGCLFLRFCSCARGCMPTCEAR